MPVKKHIRCSWRKYPGKFQICYAWKPGKWLLTPCNDREAALLWAKENEAAP
ncbi:MAG: hypothetical protein LBD55_07495 [Treponema sp.]|nr:hypothetical protein [Treponema sp.]